MKHILLALFTLFLSELGAQSIADSLNYQHLHQWCMESIKCTEEYDSEHSVYKIYEQGNFGPGGDYFEFDEDLHLIIFGHYFRGRQNGLFLYLDKDGRIKRSTNFKNGSLHGTAKVFYKNGQLRLSTDYKRGKKHGEMLGYYSNGTKLYTGRYKKDKMIGQRMYYDVKGRPANGEMTWRHESGAVKLEGKCVNGLPEGRFTHYDEDGEVELIVDYVKGLPHGAYIKYQDGKVEFKDCYEYGKYTGNQFCK